MANIWLSSKSKLQVEILPGHGGPKAESASEANVEPDRSWGLCSMYSL
jgi:hypothetical protein